MVVGSLSAGLCSDYKGVLTALSMSGLLTHDHIRVEEHTAHSSCRGPNADPLQLYCSMATFRQAAPILFFFSTNLYFITSDLFQS
jgi:hypothetical protein